jgi:hypothetical protein
VLSLDSPRPSSPITDLLKNENRFASLLEIDPKKGELLQKELQQDIDEQYQKLLNLANQTNPKKK